MHVRVFLIFIYKNVVGSLLLFLMYVLKCANQRKFQSQKEMTLLRIESSVDNINDANESIFIIVVNTNELTENQCSQIFWRHSEKQNVRLTYFQTDESKINTHELINDQSMCRACAHFIRRIEKRKEKPLTSFLTAKRNEKNKKHKQRRTRTNRFWCVYKHTRATWGNIYF